MGNTRLLAELSSGLVTASRQWQRLVDAALAHFGISAACASPLLVIARSGGGIRQVALAQQLGMEGPSLVRLLDRLGEQGLVRRESDSHDRRANQLWLTAAGQTLVGQLQQRLIELRAQVFGTLTPAEIEALLKAWQLLNQANARLD